MHNVGLDLGTTHTVVAHHGQALAVANAALVPSVVAYPPDGHTLVGARARLRRPVDPEHTIASAKRVIGLPFGAGRRDQFQSYFGAELVAAEGGGYGFRTRQGIVIPTEISSEVVAHALDRVGITPESLDSVVVTVPSSFGLGQRAATVEAVRRAGVRRVGLIEEPVATALAYLQRSSLRYAAVYDLGGGTFDVAVVDCLRHPFTVRAHVGDPTLGGDNIDLALASHIADNVLQQHRWDLRSERTTFNRLLHACEWAKCTLSEHTEVELPLHEIDPAAPADLPAVMITRALLASIVTPLIHQTFALCDDVLSQAGIRATDVQAVFLAGGSSRLPGLTHRVESYFQKRPRQDLNPMHVVALGASYAVSRPNLCELLDLPVSRRQSQPEFRMKNP
ncbi:MAG: Hsp70 family protein [Myxococcota bacterium]